MHFIKTPLVLHIKKNEHACAQPKRKAKDVDERVALVFEQVSEGHFKIAPAHDFVFLNPIVCLNMQKWVNDQ